MVNLRALFHRVADRRAAPTPLLRLVQGGLGIVSPFYAGAVYANRLLYESGARKRRTLPATVISVGNITLGGTGKTPFTIWLAKWLLSEQRRPAILTRGYGRADERRLLVVHDGKSLRATTKEAGDEPVLMGRSLASVPVIACSSRFRAGRAALRRFPIDTFVLDDGLQHLALERQCEVVLLDATRPLTELRLFPRGTLREPRDVLRRAHLVVLTRCNQSRRATRMAAGLRAWLRHIPVVRTEVSVEGATRLATRETVSLASLDGRRALLACGIGNPGSFRATIEGLGMAIAGQRVLADHARPTRAEVQRWDALRRRLKADCIVVTEKDAVKLLELGALPESIIALRAGVRFCTPEEEETARKAIRARLHAGPLRGFLGQSSRPSGNR